MDTTPEELLTFEEAVQILKVPPSTLRQWVRKGRVTPERHESRLYFRPDDLRHLFEEERAAPASKRERILIIEDDPLVGDSLKKFLGNAGFEAVMAPLGLAALDFAARENFDLILTDIRMPGMNGLEALQAIRDLRRQFGKPAVPEIILTAYDDPAVRREAGRMGVRGFLLKPFESDSLLAAVAGAVKFFKEHQEPSHAFES